MHLKSSAPLVLLLLAAATPPSISASVPGLTPRGVPAERPKAKLAPPPATAGKKDDTVITTPGTVDAPVDGLDGKPHSGPGLYPEVSGKKGTGEVGVSGGGASVDIKKPPPHTGEHEIVSIEDPAEGDDSLVGVLFGSLVAKESFC